MANLIKMQEYIEFFYNNGFDLHPLLTNSKVPKRKDWSKAPSYSMPEIKKLYSEEISADHQYNLGFRPGKQSHIVAENGKQYDICVIDIDVKSIDKDKNGIDRTLLLQKDAETAEKYKKIAKIGNDFLAKYKIIKNTLTGSGGSHSYLFVEKPIFDNLNLKANLTIFKAAGIEIELLATGKNCVLPPSIHPDTLLPYKLENDKFNFINNENELIKLIKSKQEPTVTNSQVNKLTADTNNSNIVDLCSKLSNYKDKINGFEFEFNLIGYCKDNGLMSKVHDCFKSFYADKYDARRTDTIINQAFQKSNIRHAGSFIKMLQDADLYVKFKHYFVNNIDNIIKNNTPDTCQEHKGFKFKPEKFNNSLMFVKPAPLKFVLTGLRERTVGIFAGRGGTGKSYIGLASIMSYADASKRLNYLNLFNNSRGQAGYLTLEDDIELIHHRMYNLMNFFKVRQNDELLQNFEIDSLYGQQFSLADKTIGNKVDINKDAIDYLTYFCTGKKFVILDTLRRLSSLNESDSGEMGHVLRTIEAISFKTGASILINSHVSKAKQEGQSNVRGAGSITDDTRFTLLLQKEQNNLTLSFEKVNAIKIPEAIPLQWQEWIDEETRDNHAMINIVNIPNNYQEKVNYKPKPSMYAGIKEI